MLNENRFWLFILVTVLIGTFVYEYSEAQQTNEEKQEECRYLNSVRANFTFCCQYPILVIWRWQWYHCLEECDPDLDDDEYDCCHFACCLKNTKILVTNEDNPDVLRTDYTGLIYSFLLSIGNDSRWVNTVSTTAQTCFEQFDGANEGYDCGVIPNELYTIIDCCYIENFIRCPTMRQIPECGDTVRYVKKCLRGDD